MWRRLDDTLLQWQGIKYLFRSGFTLLSGVRGAYCMPAILARLVILVGVNDIRHRLKSLQAGPVLTDITLHAALAAAFGLDALLKIVGFPSSSTYRLSQSRLAILGRSVRQIIDTR